MKKTARKVLASSLGVFGYALSSGKIVPEKLLHSKRYQVVLKEMEVMYSEKFQRTLPLKANRLELLQELIGTSPSEAFHILYNLNQSMSLAGDICEFGVAQGTTSTLMANEIKDGNKNIWLFDSFQGLPMPTEKDLLKDDIFNLGTMKAYAGEMACGLEMVTQRLNKIAFPFNRVKVIPGFIETTIGLSALPDKVCFAYVDFDFYEPIKIAMTFLDRVLVKGGCMIIDDYDFFSTGAKTAVDEFMEEFGTSYSIEVPDKGLGHFCVITKK